MSKERNTEVDSDMLPEYDFRGGVRGKYWRPYAEGANVVVLDPDVARAFPTAEDVNRALRSLMAAAQERAPRTRAE
jgi:hypothetical protein